jgi:hypothetical protein
MELLGDVGQVEARSFRLEIVLILVQNGCTDWDEHTIGSEIIFDTEMELLGDVGQVKARFSLC